MLSGSKKKNLYVYGNVYGKFRRNFNTIKRGFVIMNRIDLKPIKRPLIIFLILILLSLTVPFLLPATFLGAYLCWIILSLIAIIYGLIVIGGSK